MEWKFKYYDVNKGPDWALIEKECDWFRDMKEVPQDKIWHAEGDVQIHTKMVCENLFLLPEFISLSDQDKHIMFVGALMHDIEKRSTTITEVQMGLERVVAPKHALIGEKTTREILYKEFECPFHIREKICKVVRWHGKPLHECSNKQLINLATQVPLYMLTMIAKADILGRICEDADEHLERIEFFAMQAEELWCFHGKRNFSSEFAEYEYLKNGNLYYEPFDETKFEVVMMTALPASGKDTYIAKHFKDWPVISLDEIRLELGIKSHDKNKNGTVAQLAKERAKEYMRKHKNFIWNATVLTAQFRAQLVDLFESYGGKVTMVYIEVPYKTLMNQNASRPEKEVVPSAVIDKMIRKLEPPVREEACRLILHV
jgi:predicted kinase